MEYDSVERMNFVTRESKRLDEYNQKYTTALDELEEQACYNKLNSGISCREYCDYYATPKCRHPEKVFPNF